MDLAYVRSQLGQYVDAKVVGELLAEYEETKRNYYLGGLRLAEVEGGRFCEAAFRILEQASTGKFTPIGKQLESEKLIRQLENQTALGDSLRLHIPRALRFVYDIRNKRDAAHLADGIDPNLQDSTIVCSILYWIFAELVRLYHK